MTPLSELRLADAALANMLGGLEAGIGGGGGDLGGSGLREFIVGDGGRLGSILVRVVKRLVFSTDLFRGLISCSFLALLLCDCEVTGLNMNLSLEPRSEFCPVNCPDTDMTSELDSLRVRDRDEVGSPVEGSGSVVCVGSMQLIALIV